MFELTRSQAKTLQDIAAKPDGRPEAYYTGARGRTVAMLTKHGLIERKPTPGLGAGMSVHRLVATEAGRQAAARLMRGGKK